MEMNDKEALRIVLAAASSRRKQYQALIDNSDKVFVTLNDLLPDLEGLWVRTKRDDSSEASDLAGMIGLAIDTVAGYGTKTPLFELDRLESIMCEMISDKQGEIEEKCEKELGQDDAEIPDDWRTNEETGEPEAIVYPENAAPELDDARGHIRDAIDILRGLE